MKLFVVLGCVTVLLAWDCGATTGSESDAVLRWNSAALQGVRDPKLGAPVDRGPLLVEDGMGAERYQARFPRVYFNS